jgi:hopene-associated glycosyltransferase HpnB
VTLLAALSLAAWIVLAFGRGFFWREGEVLAFGAPREAPAVDVVVPARDEAAFIEPVLRSLLAQDYAGPVRVILVDDQSTDGTGAIAREIVDGRLTVIEGAARPAGWSGKLWAVAQGVAAARAPFLLLTDADIAHAPGHLAALMARAEAGRLDLVSEMVALHCASLPERALIPAFVHFFAMLYPFAWVNDPGAATAAAAGGTMLVRAEALARAGGIEALRGALIDDVTLAGLLKRQGRIWLGHSRLARSLRPYAGWGEVWRVIARTAYVQLRFSPWLLAGTVAGMALLFAVPPVAALAGHGAARAAGLAAWGAMALTYLPTLARFGRSPLWAPFLPLVALFYTGATVGSALNHHRGIGIQWKQRAYT